LEILKNNIKDGNNIKEKTAIEEVIAAFYHLACSIYSFLTSALLNASLTIRRFFEKYP